MTHTIFTQKFGFEIEFSGITRSRAIEVLGETFGTPTYSNTVYDQQGRAWKIVSDGSVTATGGGDANELVSPPLTYADMELVQEVVRNLRKARAKVNSSCGMHVHVDIQSHNAKSLKNLVKYFAKYERMFIKSAAVLENRLGHYTRPIAERHPTLLQNLDRIQTLDQLKQYWYADSSDTVSYKYNNSRYCTLNLHNIWYKGWSKGTVEFRMFNSTLHAGEIRTYIVLALAINAKALNANSVNSRNNETVPDEFLFPKVLGGLGIVARDEVTKNVYKHLTKNMRAVV